MVIVESLPLLVLTVTVAVLVPLATGSCGDGRLHSRPRLVLSGLRLTAMGRLALVGRGREADDDWVGHHYVGFER